MSVISLYNIGPAKYSCFDTETREFSPVIDEDQLPLEHGWRTTGLGTSPDGRYIYYQVVKYSLRDAMARKLRPRFFLKDKQTATVKELFTKWDRSPFEVTTLLFCTDFFLVVASYDYDNNVLFRVDPDGEEPKEIWRSHAYPYGFNRSPDGKEFSFHLANFDAHDNPFGLYAIYRMDQEGEKSLVCAEKDHLFFNDSWSPDGQYLLFQDCIPSVDPAHHYSDLVVCRPDGSDFRRLTNGRPMLFATAFGLPGHRAGGSNYPVWTADRKIIFSRMTSGAHQDFHFDASQRNHEELIYDPSMSVGGCGFNLLDMDSGEETVLTSAHEGEWDFRPVLNKEKKLLLYTHSQLEKPSEIRLMDLKTGEIRILTTGIDELGADHPRFIE